MEYETIIIEVEDGVGLVRLNRPKVLNALNSTVSAELGDALEQLDADENVGCIVLTGNEKAFAAGADISEMAGESAVDLMQSDRFRHWDRIRRIKKPVIAAVSGYALGGGCELALACDMIVASETAKFGQPEVTLGIIPGAGGTQRLTRAVGKALAMEVILANRWLSAGEAERAGLVNRVVPVESYLEEAMGLARNIASRAPLAVRLAKESINRAFETGLTEGLAGERQNFYLLFATEDQAEGMRAFMEKRDPEFRGR
ncbi:MAG: enoyl-CoA hydratase-related protein [Anaerolineae bacterium]